MGPASPEPDRNQYLTPKQLLERYQNAITLRTLANWRSTGEGPKFLKLGGRVLYSLRSVTEWERIRTRGTALAAMLLLARFYMYHFESIGDVFTAFFT